MDKRVRALLGMMMVSLFWAPSFSVTKGLLACAGPISLTCLRFLAAALLTTVAWLLVRARCGAGRAGIRKEDRMRAALLTAMVTAHYILSNIASVSLDETESIMFSSFQGLLTLIVASLLLNSKIRPFTSIYVGVAGVGAVLLIEFQTPGYGLEAGYVIMFAAMVMWVIYCVLMTRMVDRYPILDIMLQQFWAVGIALLPWLWIERGTGGGWDVGAVWRLSYLAVCCTAICFTLNAVGIREIGPIPSSLVTILGPALVAVLKMAETRNALSMRQIVGIGLVLAGSMLVILDVAGLSKPKLYRKKKER